MGDGWAPRTGDDWFRWVEGELRSLRRHRHQGAVAGMAFGSSAQVQLDEFGNRIWSPGGETGTFATAVRDTTPPPPPSKPTATVRLGVVTLTWDGFAVERQLMPADLLHVEVHRSMDGTFYPADNTLVSFIQPGGGTLVMPDQAYNSVWYYRLRAVDKAGNMSDAGPVENAVTTPLVNTDIIGQVLDGASFMDGTIDTAALADGSVSGAKIAAGSISESHLSFTLPDGTVVTFSPTAPATPGTGDLWYDTDDGNKLYHWDGASWVAATYGPGAIADNAITEVKIVANAVTETKIATDAVTTPKIAANAVTANEIAANTITANEIAANAVTADEIAANTITAAEIAADTITGNEIAADTITASEIAALTITAAEIAANTIGAGQIQANSLTADVIAANAIGTDELAANSVVAGKIVANAVTAEKIAALAVEADKIAANAVTADKIMAGSITAEKLAAILILVNKIASSSTGRRWEADQYGIRLYDTDGSVIINLPTDGLAPAVFHGVVVAESLSIMDQFALRGLLNEISAGGRLILAAGATAPSSPPGITVDWDWMTSVSPYSNEYDPYRHGLVRDSGYYYTAQADESFFLHLHRYSTTTGTRDGTFNISSVDLQVGDGGVTILGTTIFVLGRDAGAHQWYVEGYSLSTLSRTEYWALPSLTNWADGYWMGFGSNGTDLLVGYRTTGGSVNIARLSSTGTLIETITTNITGWLWNVTSCNYGNFDYGSARYIVTAENREVATPSPLTAVLAYSGSGSVWNLQQNEQWPVPGQTRGMYWDSTLSQFVRLRDTNQISFFTGIRWTTETNVWWASQTFYDSAGTTHETDQSPRTQFTMLKRAMIRWNGGTIPTGGAEDPNQLGLYLGRGTSDPGRAQMERQSYVSAGIISLYGANLPAVGNNATNPPPSTNNFPGGTPGQIRAQDDTKFLVKGDGTGNWGSITVGASKTTIGTHVLRASALDTATLTSGAWTDIDWTGTTTVNEDSWTLSADGLYWTCPLAGTYAIFCRFNFDLRKARIEMLVETSDGSIQVMSATNENGHDYLCIDLPAARMAATHRISFKVYNYGASATIYDTGYLQVTRLG